MHALEVEEFGELEKLQVRDVPKPKAGAGEVLAKNRLCGRELHRHLSLLRRLQGFADLSNAALLSARC